MYYVFCKYMFEGGYFMWIDAYIPQPVLISPSANFQFYSMCRFSFIIILHINLIIWHSAILKVKGSKEGGAVYR